MTKSRPELRPEFIMYTAGGGGGGGWIFFKNAKFREIPQTSYRIFGHPPPPPPLLTKSQKMTPNPHPVLTRKVKYRQNGGMAGEMNV